MERRANLKALDPQSSLNFFNSGETISSKSLNHGRFISDQAKESTSGKISSLLVNSSHTDTPNNKLRAQGALQAISQYLKVDICAFESIDDVTDTVIHTIKSLQEKSDSMETLLQEKAELEKVVANHDQTINQMERTIQLHENNSKLTFESIFTVSNEFATHEQEYNAKINEYEKRISALNKELFQIKESEEKLKSENSDLLQKKSELSALQSKVSEMSNENKVLESKIISLRKLAKEKENKADKLSAQLTSTRTKYANKLKSVESETGKTIDSLIVELKLVKDINEKLLTKAGPNSEEAKAISTTTFDSLYEWLFDDDSTNSYLGKVYENRYLVLLNTLKEFKDSNDIYQTVIQSLLKILSDNFEKCKFVNLESLSYLKMITKEFQQRKVLKSNDLEFIKKVLDAYHLQIRKFIDESVSNIKL
ncbi:hypothetical protein SBY92_001333 [Candida maltosa Xu316]